jgi:hypothetical protein
MVVVDRGGGASLGDWFHNDRMAISAVEIGNRGACPREENSAIAGE